MNQSHMLLELVAKEALNARLDEAARQRLVNRSNHQHKNPLAQMVKRFLSALVPRASKVRQVKQNAGMLQARTQK